MAFLRTQYAKSFSFLRRRVRIIFGICVLVFLLLCVGSYFLLLQYSDAAEQVYMQFSQMVDSAGVMDEAGNISAMGLFLHNAMASGMSVVYGVMPFAFLPALSLLMNGVVIGGVLALLRSSAQVSVFRTVVFGLLPHGIFELPAILLAMALGIYLCKNLTGLILKKDWADRFEDSLENIVRVYCTVVLPLLLVAGVIEAYVTPILMQLYV